MSALEEYRKHTRIADEILSEQYATTLKAATVPREYADAAIAELEADSRQWAESFKLAEESIVQLQAENERLRG